MLAASRKQAATEINSPKPSFEVQKPFFKRKRKEDSLSLLSRIVTQ